MSARPEMSWWGWGDPAQAAVLPAPMLELARQALGLPATTGPRAGPPRPLASVRLPESALPGAAWAAIEAIVGAGHLHADAESRVCHTRGKSTSDLLLMRSGRADAAPDAVALPGTHDEVLALLGACTEHRVAVVPFGGGTSVVGGLEPDRSGFAGVLALDLRRMDRLLGIDEESRIATLEPGLRGPEAEALLGARGYTIGHHPQSFEYATLGGFAAARSSGQASAGYGRFDERVVRITAATPVGAIELGRAPRSAAGPDLRQVLLGSEGAFGVITSLGVEVRPLPAERHYDGWRLPSFADGASALRALAQVGPLPTVLRLSDEAETAVNLARPAAAGAAGADGEAGEAGTTGAADAAGVGRGGCLAIAGYEGRADEVPAWRERASSILREHGGVIERGAGAAWAAGRYRAPYLRDALLAAGALVETLETATFWSGLPRLYDAVGAALRDALAKHGTTPLVLCHISHVYRSGASLYFTVAAAASEDPLAQWRAAKAAASEAILAAGGSISHHHGIGRDHRDSLAREIGPLGVSVLRAVKAALDPAGIMNPGVLVP